MKDKFQNVVNRAKIGLMTKGSVFITTILFSLKLSWNKSVPTACTNGTELIINPDFFMGLDPEERIGLLAHEAWHVAFMHMFRLMGRDPEVFNQAADHVINLMLEKNGLTVPAGGLKDPRFKDMSAEQVYDLLIQKPQLQNKLPDLDLQAPGAGDNNDQDGKSKAEKEALAKEAEDKVKDILIKASIQSKKSNDKPGTIPGELEIELSKLTNPKLPWNEILSNYLTSMAKEDYSFRRPNRRFMPDHYLPSLYSERVGHIAVAVDTSGSVSDKQFNAFISEINLIKESMNPELVTVVDFDTSIKKVHTLKEDDSVTSLKFSGRGGTDLYPVFDHFNKTKPMVLIVFSDLCCRKIEKNPGYPVVWVCINNPKGKVNFGKLIHMEVDYD